MAIYEIKPDRLGKVPETTFSAEGIRERDDLQRLLRDQIEILSPDTLVVSEEFGEWEDSRRRIDLLGIDKSANLIVIELKRTEDGGHMELQAIRYAAMVSALSFSRVVELYGDFLGKLGRDDDPESSLLEFLEWDEVAEDAFAQEVKIVLASAEFSRELTTAVIWLNSNGLDITCVRLKPYKGDGKVLLDVQQVLPLPEAEEYQVRIRNKTRLERVSRTQNRDLTKYDVTLGDTTHERLAKRRAIFGVVKYLCDSGIDPDEIDSLITWKNNMFYSFEGHLNSAEFEKVLSDKQKAEGKKPQPKRYFISGDELIYAKGRTYAFHKMWGISTAKALDILVESYKGKNIAYRESD